MHSFTDQVQLKVTTRPLRLAYLVETTEDLKNAVKLYTHTWGGAGNAIIPIPQNENEVEELSFYLDKVDPDYIFIPSNITLPRYVDVIINQRFSKIRPISKDEIDKYIELKEEIHIPVNIRNSNTISYAKGYLPHIMTVLSTLSSSTNLNLYVRELDSPYDFYLMLQNGLLYKEYQNFLVKDLHSQLLLKIDTPEQLFKTSLISAGKNPIYLTLIKNRKTKSLSFTANSWIDQPSALCFFLDDQENIKLASAFWNSRSFYPDNKLFLPKNVFLENLELYIQLALSIMPSIKAIYIAIVLENKEEAETLLKLVQIELRQQKRQDIKVWITYEKFYLEFQKTRFYCNSPNTNSQSVNPDGSIYLTPTIPLQINQKEFVFSFDVEITNRNGHKLILPKNNNSSILLSNSLEDIEYLEESEELPPLNHFRATNQEISGMTLLGQETGFYIHNDTTLITRHLEAETGIKIEPNRHTRYAEGFIKRLGGLEKIHSLVDKGGLNILISLSSDKAQQSGFTQTQIISYLRDRIGLEYKQAQANVYQQLPSLLANGLVRRGYSLQCPVCDLEDWYSIDKLSEFIECHGCLENFQLQEFKQQEFYYKPNELSLRLIQNGGVATLMTAKFFRTFSPTPFIQFGGDIIEQRKKPNKKSKKNDNTNKNENEIDLIILQGNLYAIAECKYCPAIDQDKQIKNITESLEKTIKVAERLKCRIIFLTVIYNAKKSDELKVEALFYDIDILLEKAKKEEINIIVLTEKEIKVLESEKLRDLDQLIIPKNHPQNIVGIGERPTSYSPGTIQPFDETILKQWREELIDSN